MRKTAIAAGLMAMALPVSSALADVSEDRDLEAFSKVEFEGLMEVNIKVGDTQSFTITANKEKYLESVSTRVRNGVLRVDMDVDNGFFSFFKDVEVTLDITVTSLEYVEMDGMGNIDIEGVDSEEFELVMDGLGTANIEGRCGSARMVLDGMGDLNARDFECERVRIMLDGMGDAEVYASEYVNVNLDGFGNVEVYGDPEDRDVRHDGMGEVDFE